MSTALRQFLNMRCATVGSMRHTGGGGGGKWLHTSSQLKSEVSMDSIKELRKRTGAPIIAVKKALLEQGGDIEAAIDHLRKLGASMAARKAHREASEGLIGISISEDRTTAAMIELNSETDFVARTPQFHEALSSITNATLNNWHSSGSYGLTLLNVEDVLNLAENRDVLSNAVSALGENLVLRRACCVCIENGRGGIFSYAHGAGNERIGKIGAIVSFEGSSLDEVGTRVAMHVAAAAPNYISVESIPEDELRKERTILMESIESEQKLGEKPKPPAILQKIADGRMRKWYATSVLEEQEMLVESPIFGSTPRSVAQHLTGESEDATVSAMVRFSVGEK